MVYLKIFLVTEREFSDILKVMDIFDRYPMVSKLPLVKRIALPHLLQGTLQFLELDLLDPIGRLRFDVGIVIRRHEISL